MEIADLFLWAKKGNTNSNILKQIFRPSNFPLRYLVPPYIESEEKVGQKVCVQGSPEGII